MTFNKVMQFFLYLNYMVNKVILVGNTGGDPEVRNFENGGKLARVNIATNEQIYNPSTQERRDHTEWHTLVFNRSLASVVEMYVKKGSQIYVEGKLRTRDWTDANNVSHRSTEVHVDTMRMLGRRSENSAPVSQGGGYNTAPQQSAMPQAQPAMQQPAVAAAPSYNNATQQSQGFGTPATEEGAYMNESDDLPF